MIQAYFQRSETSQIVSVELSGHAESGPYGYDLVCAAVSALSIGTVNSLTELGEMTLDTKSHEEDGGFLSFELPNSLSDEQKHIAQILLESLLLSLSSIGKEYPDFIIIKEN